MVSPIYEILKLSSFSHTEFQSNARILKKKVDPYDYVKYYGPNNHNNFVLIKFKTKFEISTYKSVFHSLINSVLSPLGKLFQDMFLVYKNDISN